MTKSLYIPVYIPTRYIYQYTNSLYIPVYQLTIYTSIPTHCIYQYTNSLYIPVYQLTIHVYTSSLYIPASVPTHYTCIYQCIYKLTVYSSGNYFCKDECRTIFSPAMFNSLYKLNKPVLQASSLSCITGSQISLLSLPPCCIM